MGEVYRFLKSGALVEIISPVWNVQLGQRNIAGYSVMRLSDGKTLFAPRDSLQLFQGCKECPAMQARSFNYCGYCGTKLADLSD